MKSLSISKALITPFSILVNLTAEKLILVLILIQPLLDFLKNQPLLNNIKHGIYRLFALLLVFYTITYIAETTQKRVVFRGKIFNKNYLLLYSLTALFSVIIAFSQSEMGIGRVLIALTTLPLLISMIYIIPFWINSLTLIQSCIRTYFYAMMYVLLIGFIQLFLSIGGEDAYRIKSVFNDPNLFARFLLIGLFFLIYQIIYKNYEIISKKVTIYLTAATIFQIILSFSRSAYIALFLGLLFVALGIKKKAIKIFLVSFVIIISVLAVIFMMNQRFAQSSLIEPSGFGRILLIIGGIDMIKQHWITGIGYTNFPEIFSKYYVKYSLGMSMYNFENLGFTASIHNWLIEVFSEQGIFGLIGFVGIFTSVSLKLKKLKKKITSPSFLIVIRGFLMMIFVFLFQGFFYHTFISQFFFWILFGILNAAINVANNYDEKLS